MGIIGKVLEEGCRGAVGDRRDILLKGDVLDGKRVVLKLGMKVVDDAGWKDRKGDGVSLWAVADDDVVVPSDVDNCSVCSIVDGIVVAAGGVIDECHCYSDHSVDDGSWNGVDGFALDGFSLPALQAVLADVVAGES